MEPRSADRGNIGARRARRVHGLASMEPRSADRGNQFHTVYVDRQESLQWSRDLLIAEIAASVKSCPAGLSASMEPRSADRGNGPGRRICGAVECASMEPRSADRGNGLHVSNII